MNFFYIFLIFAQNIDCGYKLEPPLTSTHLRGSILPEHVFLMKKDKKRNICENLLKSLWFKRQVLEFRSHALYVKRHLYALGQCTCSRRLYLGT